MIGFLLRAVIGVLAVEDRLHPIEADGAAGFESEDQEAGGGMHKRQDGLPPPVPQLAGLYSRLLKSGLSPCEATPTSQILCTCIARHGIIYCLSGQVHQI